MSEPRVIKKYPNRRLYDTVESRYITLADIRRLVTERVDFVVIDKKSQTDITRAILLQVIAEQEHGSEPVLSRDFLSQVIRSYGGQLQGVVASYLEQTLRLFTAQQREMRERIRQLAGPEATEAVSQLAQKNYQRWRTLQDEIFRTLFGNQNRARERDDEERVHDPGPRP
ncbi:MAG TPA: polyhydroxyalkanoate synthesis repressor PhaR [Steroidobacteraceae bacterium]|nr:polyhydroxyalkanoate synthesis repressor PhaR [Steroidobacteraceae bacterium]HNS27821.1 polyhydroxyalkanoate synthesis repressor PhaR [Steroidobacteraceae bacterium]